MRKRAGCGSPTSCAGSLGARSRWSVQSLALWLSRAIHHGLGAALIRVDPAAGRDAVRVGCAQRGRDDRAACEARAYIGRGAAGERRVGGQEGQWVCLVEVARKHPDLDEWCTCIVQIRVQLCIEALWHERPRRTSYSRPVSLRRTSGGPGVDSLEPLPDVCRRLGNVPA